MVTYPDFWIQYDYQIGTYRGVKDGVVYGGYENEYETVSSIAAAMGVTVTDDDITELNNEKAMGTG